MLKSLHFVYHDVPALGPPFFPGNAGDRGPIHGLTMELLRTVRARCTKRWASTSRSLAYVRYWTAGSAGEAQRPCRYLGDRWAGPSALTKAFKPGLGFEGRLSSSCGEQHERSPSWSRAFGASLYRTVYVRLQKKRPNVCGAMGATTC